MTVHMADNKSLVSTLLYLELLQFHGLFQNYFAYSIILKVTGMGRFITKTIITICDLTANQTFQHTLSYFHEENNLMHPIKPSFIYKLSLKDGCFQLFT